MAYPKIQLSQETFEALFRCKPQRLFNEQGEAIYRVQLNTEEWLEDEALWRLGQKLYDASFKGLVPMVEDFTEIEQTESSLAGEGV